MVCPLIMVLRSPGIASWIVVAGLLLGFSVSSAQETATSIRFRDATESSGLSFKHQDGSDGNRYLIELMGAGICSFDADGDGLVDVYMLTGFDLSNRGVRPAEDDSSNQLFLNRGGFQFRDCTAFSGAGARGYSLGVTAGDFDHDGFTDLYISNFGPNVLLRNNGDGTFTDVSDEAGVDGGDQFGAGVTFLDVNNDGNLDLFVGNYVEFDFDRHFQLAPRAFPYSPGPKDYPPAKDRLFVSNGDGTFRDASQDSRIASVAGPSMGVVAADFDDDGDIDVFVACDGAPNLLYINDGAGNFTEEALFVGVAFDLRGNANGGMGVDAADINGEGLIDLFVTDYSDQFPEVFLNGKPAGIFEDAARRLQVGGEVFQHVNWGIGLVDLDLDGDVDAFICNGHLLENAKDIEPNTAYGVANVILENDAGRRFRNVTSLVGDALRLAESSRGAAFDDLDNDGDIDAVILNCDSSCQVLENELAGGKDWIGFRLVGTKSNRTAVGAKVVVRARGAEKTLWKLNGRGYQSHYGERLHTGLGARSPNEPNSVEPRVEEVIIFWPGNPEPQVIKNLSANQYHTIVEPH
ncbi:CRTAC1 family protein [Pirellulaceae bacterium SH449]